MGGGAGGPKWVKTGKAQCEHIFSGLPPTADIDVWHLRNCCKVRGRSIGVMPSHAVWHQGAKVERPPRANLDLSQGAALA